VFTHDLFNPSIRLKEDILISMPEISSGKDNPVLVLGTPLGKDDSTLIPEANMGASSGPTRPN
jgi:hypothetical protein